MEETNVGNKDNSVVKAKEETTQVPKEDPIVEAKVENKEEIELSNRTIHF